MKKRKPEIYKGPTFPELEKEFGKKENKMSKVFKDFERDFNVIKRDMNSPKLEGYMFISVIDDDTNIVGEIPTVCLAEAIAGILIKQKDIVPVVMDILIQNEVNIPK